MISLIDDEADTEIGRHNNKGLRFYGFYFSLVDWNAASHFLCIHVHHFGSGFAEFFTNEVKIICVKKKKKKIQIAAAKKLKAIFSKFCIWQWNKAPKKMTTQQVVWLVWD